MSETNCEHIWLLRDINFFKLSANTIANNWIPTWIEKILLSLESKKQSKTKQKKKKRKNPLISKKDSYWDLVCWCKDILIWLYFLCVSETAGKSGSSSKQGIIKDNRKLPDFYHYSTPSHFLPWFSWASSEQRVWVIRQREPE